MFVQHVASTDLDTELQLSCMLPRGLNRSFERTGQWLGEIMGSAMSWILHTKLNIISPAASWSRKSWGDNG
jgi:hypothetical protein